MFDHVYAWEPKSKATVSFKAVPNALLPALHFYPDPVNAKVRIQMKETKEVSV